MKRIALFVAAILVLALAGLGHTYLIQGGWPDGSNIVMDDVLLPADTWSSPAQFQMSEWNEVDTTDNSHPFRINANPEFSFGANDGDNTIGFLDEAGLMSQYGLSFTNALAWTISWTSGGFIDECDIVIDSSRPWALGPNNSTWFQSTVLHELGHCRGLGHYNNFQSMMNSGQSKYLRNEILYMDDKEGIRQNNSFVSEKDAVIYNKWHNGTSPQWMSMSPLTLREGQTINLNDITIENRGTIALTPLRFGIYVSTNDIISTGDIRLSSGIFNEGLGRFSFSTFDWSANMPSVNDCGTRYIGAIVDYDGIHAERFEGNNNVVLTNGVPFSGQTFVPTQLTLLLAEDFLEPNDSLGAAPLINLPFFSSNLSVDQDLENDYYRFNLGQSATVEVDVFFSDAAGDLDLQLLNSSGAVLASSTSTSDNESATVALVAGGPYYIRVYGFGTGSCNEYTLDAQLGATCGNGVVESGEECDPPTTPSGCCTNSCQFANSGTSCSSDGNQCTLNVCNTTGTCTHPSNTGVTCNDGLFCTENDTCTAAANCEGTALVCPSDSDPCTLEACNESLNVCESLPDPGACDVDVDLGNATASCAGAQLPLTLRNACNVRSIRTTVDDVPNWGNCTSCDVTPALAALGFACSVVDIGGDCDVLISNPGSNTIPSSAGFSQVATVSFVGGAACSDDGTVIALDLMDTEVNDASDEPTCVSATGGQWTTAAECNLGDPTCDSADCTLFDILVTIDQALGLPDTCEADVDCNNVVNIFDVLCMIDCGLGVPGHCLTNECTTPTLPQECSGTQTAADAVAAETVGPELFASLDQRRPRNDAAVVDLQLAGLRDTVRGIRLTLDVPSGWQVRSAFVPGAAEVLARFHQEDTLARVLVVSPSGAAIALRDGGVVRLELVRDSEVRGASDPARVLLVEAIAADMDGRRISIEIDPSDAAVGHRSR